MSTVRQLFLLHVVIGLAVAFCIASLRSRRLDDLSYDVRMSLPLLRRFLMPGRLAEREVWLRQQRIMSWIGLAFSAVVYLLAMIKILS